MQAGESLSFIPIPDVLETPAPLSAEEYQESLYTYYIMTKQLLDHEGPGVRTIVRPEESGMITAKEASYRISYNDGSYLHVIAFKHETAAGELLDIGLAIGEHTAEGAYQGGYMYELTSGSELQYTANLDVASDEEEDDPEFPWHYSLIDQYLYKDELFNLQFSDDEALRERIATDLEEWQQEGELAVAERELGMSWHQPKPKDLEDLKFLMKFAQPYDIPRRPASEVPDFI